MSRLASLSTAAIQAMLAPETGVSLITLLTLTGGGLSETLYLADSYTQRLSSTTDDVIYGVESRGRDYVFIPMQLTLPTEDPDGAPRFNIVFNDVTKLLIPHFRTLQSSLKVKLELVLSSTPDTVEAEFPDFSLSGFTYNADTISAELTVESLANEPFPAHTMTPSYFPGLF